MDLGSVGSISIGWVQPPTPPRSPLHPRSASLGMPLSEVIPPVASGRLKTVTAFSLLENTKGPPDVTDAPFRLRFWDFMCPNLGTLSSVQGTVQMGAQDGLEGKGAISTLIGPCLAPPLSYL